MFKAPNIFGMWSPKLELEASIQGNANGIYFNNALAHIVYLNNKTENKQIPQQHEEVLDISFPNNTRVSIIGKKNISIYCKMGDLSSIPKDDILCIQKERLGFADFPEHNVRIRLAEEKEAPLPSMDDASEKTFRLKKRISITTADSLCRYDFTVVKQFKSSSVANMSYKINEHREIEMEYVGDTGDTLDTKAFKKHLRTLLKAYYSDPELTPLSLKKSVLNDYIVCVSNHELLNTRSIKGAIEENITQLTNTIESIYKNMQIQSKNPINISQFVVGAKPTTLERTNVMKNIPDNIFTGYKATIKADGERTLIFIDENQNVYLINSNLDIKFAGNTENSELKGNTLYDGELVYFVGKCHVYIFDCYIHADENISANNLEFRIKKCTQFATSHYTFLLKKYFDVTEVQKNYDLHNLLSFEMDGIIYIPEGKAETSGTWKNAYKWKPHEQNTIDFLVKFVRDDNNDVISVIRDGVPYTTLQLFVAHSATLKNGGRAYKAKKFTTHDVDHHKMVIVKDSRCKNNDPVLDGQVVEASYDIEKKTWVPYRVRYDKTWAAALNKTVTMNNEKSALNIWNTITKPVSLQDLVNGIQMEVPSNVYFKNTAVARSQSHLARMNNFHGSIKSNLYETVSMKVKAKKIKIKPHLSLLDLACGKGGDISKWKNAHFRRVLGIDLIPDNILNDRDGAISRLAKNNIDEHKTYTFVPMDMSKPLGVEQIDAISDKSLKDLANCLWGQSEKSDCVEKFHGLATMPFDVVSCQFAIHYNFETEEKISGFLDNVVKYLKPGGYFIGTCFDGDTVAKKLENAKDGVIQHKLEDGKVVWSVTRNYSDDYKNTSFGQEITVYIETINVDHTEFLVPYKLLKKLLKNVGLTEVESHMFKDIRAKNETVKLEDHEIEFSDMNRQFIFQKSSKR